MSCTCSFAGCFNDSCGSGSDKKGSGVGTKNKIIIETDGRAIKMNGVEFKNKVNEQTILPVGFHGLVYEVSHDIFFKIGMTGDAKLTVQIKCNGVSGVLCFCECTNGKYYVVFSDNCKPIVVDDEIISFFKNFVYVYFHSFVVDGHCSNFFYCCDKLEIICFFNGIAPYFDEKCINVFFGCSNLWSVSFGRAVSDMCKRELGTLGLTCSDKERGFFKK